jgi:hypothetical protein
VTEKEGVKGFWDVSFCSLAPFKEQVMVDPDITASHLIGVKTPAIPLKALNRLTDILVVLDLHTHPFFQFNSPFPQSKENPQLRFEMVSHSWLHLG